MKKEIVTIFTFMFAFIFLLSLASATLIVTGVPGTITSPSSSFKVNITSNQNETITLNLPPITSGTGNVSFNISNSSFSLNGTSNKTDSKLVTINYKITDPDSYFNFLDSSSYSTTLTIKGTNSSEYSKKIYFKSEDFCNGVKNLNNLLTLDQPTFKIVNGYGDSNSWYLLDNISASVDVQNNNNNYDLRNIKLSWALYTSDGNKIDSGNLDTFSLNSGDDKTVKINFQLDKNFNRIDNSGGSVYFYVKASGTIRDTTSNSVLNGNETCSYKKSEQQFIETGDDFVIPNDITINGNLVSENWFINNTLSCDSNINLGGEVYNIGSNDQNSGDYIELYNRDLGINKIIRFGNLNSFESQSFSTNFNIPKTAKEKTYDLQLSVYNNNHHIFKNSRGKESIKDIYITVKGNCKIEDPTLNVELNSSEVIAGDEMIVKLSLRNNDPKNATFAISAKDFDSWAKLEQINPETFVLGPGVSKDIYLKFLLKKTSVGDQQFNLLVMGNKYLLVNKPISVTVQKASFWKSTFGNFNWEIAGIILLNLILLIAIIFVAIKILKKR